MIASVVVVRVLGSVAVKEGMLVAPVAPVPTPVVCEALLQLKLKAPPVVPVAALSVIAACVAPVQDVVDRAVGSVVLIVMVGTTV